MRYDEEEGTPLELRTIRTEATGTGRRGPGAGVAVGIVLAALALAGGWWWLRGRARPAPALPAVAAPAVPAAAAPATAPAAEPELPLPGLDGSDAFLRAAAGGLSAHPQLAAWLLDADLARRFVAAVVAVAEGRSPSAQVGFLRPAEPFRVRVAGGRTYVDDTSFRRWDPATEVFVSIDERGTAELYRRVRPLLDAAYLEVGDPRQSFERTLGRAIGHLLAAPVPAAPVEVLAASVSYTFAERELEGLSPAQRQLLRLGPGNARRVQDKLRALAAALELQVQG